MNEIVTYIDNVPIKLILKEEAITMMKQDSDDSRRLPWEARTVEQHYITQVTP